MFGIGFGELAVVVIVLLLAVGPDRMPKLMRALGKGIREFRSTMRDLRQTVGIDDWMRDEEVRDPLGVRELREELQRTADEIRAPVGPAKRREQDPSATGQEADASLTASPASTPASRPETAAAPAPAEPAPAPAEPAPPAA
ncbi:MAG: twin-arginine translocase TatA/TatE family subunit, partial [Myxococcales bacterium]|nr:twin-arginine translocase TatA/TatE family subunit [Myxococcales bacterium]